MTGREINTLMIALILPALFLISLAMRFLGRWRIWIIPILALLGFGLLYSVIYIIDARDGIENVLLYNGLNSFLRAQSYATVIMYAVAFLLMRRKGK